jgi:hypothetical protein
MKSFLLVITLIFCLSQQAFATGGFLCKTEIKDKYVELIVSGGLSHGLPGSPFRINGELFMKDKALHAHNIANINSIPQFWFEDGKLSLLVYTESETSDELLATKLVVQTQYSSHRAKYLGTYKIAAIQGDTTKIVSGAITCEID